MIVPPGFWSTKAQDLADMSRWSKRSGSLSPSSDDPDDLLHEMSDIYGQTPPRTRHNRRQRERKQRISFSDAKFSSSMKDSRSESSFLRRCNTFDTIIFDKMCGQADDEDRINKTKEVDSEGNKRSKKSLTLARDSDRNLKLDVNDHGDISRTSESQIDSSKIPNNNMKVWCGVIETRNRFRCLRSKPVNVNDKKLDNIKTDVETSRPFVDPPQYDVCDKLPKSKKEQDRELFYDTFSFLIRLGSTDRERNAHCQMSSEESRWQNELKDLIWLELQAFHADRTPVAQDEYLCKQRDTIGSLLDEIIEYRYNPKMFHADHRKSSTNSSDIGIDDLTIHELCSGCLSMYCQSCSHSRMTALKQVKQLLSRLEIAESLYPSSQAFAAHFPLYKSIAFTGRIKAMCLWYNMTRHHYLKLRILGKLLMLLNKSMNNCETGTDSGIHSQSSTSDLETKSSTKEFEFNIVNNLDDNSTPSSSNNSNNSSSSININGYYNRQRNLICLSNPESSCFIHDNDRLDPMDFNLLEFDRQSYRKYIEEVLKTRGLSKSLHFLERLHTSVLRKASLALKKYDDFDKNNFNEEYEGDSELKRYGVWSSEAQSLNLPSYRSAFIFLSRVPLDVVHEFLRMRLEQKPEQPGPLSIKQLMREMREGLRIACIHRDRFIENLKTVMACENKNNDIAAIGIDDITEFDVSLKAVFHVYLDYLYKWMEMMAFNSDNKNIIEDEWIFVKTIADNIDDGFQIGCIKFCDINCMMIEQVKDYLISRPQEIFESIEIIDKNTAGVAVKFQLMSVGREYQGMFVEAREKIMKCLIIAKLLKKDIMQCSELSIESDLVIAIDKMKNVVLSLRECITDVIKEFEVRADEAEDGPKSEHDYLAMHTRIREIFHQAYHMGFDYYKETCKLFCDEERKRLAHHLVNFSMLWMNFVMNKCERGRGLRPRWANHGLEYLMIVCDPLNTRYLSNDEFEELKTNMDRCISHVIGTATTSLDINHHVDQDKIIKRLSRSKVSSPASPSQLHGKGPIFGGNISPRLRDTNQQKLFANMLPGIDNVDMNSVVPEYNIMRQQRVLSVIEKLEYDLDEKRRVDELIGRITDRKSDVDKIKIKLRRVTFTWQRGIKVGQGRFGKVYTVVNNQTGELLAMKEVALQPGDHVAIRRVSEELEIFEGIHHKHLVRYYGIEIQREEMLIFMEFCAEGTLESFIAGSGSCGLPEIFIRKYTHQLLLAVSILHSHGIVHRDIKTANIFLTDQTNCLKLGDFGTAVKIKSHTTMIGELQGFVGTQAYMAPEVFMKTETVGHGRAVDIWSVGCCVIEMASGKRPWVEFDSNYQIMFKVGMGESPLPPKHLCKEGVDFTTKCLQHDAKKRPTALSLLSHSFARAYDDINADLSTRVVI
ncbi:hypothetical protein PV326_014408 [Microctonus aethiopoides]|nr:hypothetical protein PV326_014408 [Microctonus aethiopoides]